MATDFDAIMNSIIAAQDNANAANLQRYNQLLGSINTLGTQVGAQGTYGKSLALMDQVGTAGRQRITEQQQKTFAAAEQDLTTRGLGNTTIREAVRRGSAHDAEMARQQMEESLAQQKAGIYQGLAGAQMQIGGMKASAIEGRYDEGPNLGMFASLLSAAAAGDKADVAQTRTSRTLSARTAAGGPGTGWGGSGGGAGGGGGIGQMGGGAVGGAGGPQPGRPGGTFTQAQLMGGKGGLNLAIDPTLPAGGGASSALSTPALGQVALGQKRTGAGTPTETAPPWGTETAGGGIGAGPFAEPEGETAGGAGQGRSTLEAEYNNLSRQYVARFGRGHGMAHSAANLEKNVAALRKALAGGD